MGGFYMEFTHHEFLYGRKIDPDICDGLIEYFEETPMGTHNIPYEDGRYWICLKREGRLAGSNNNQLDEKGKKSTDLGVPYLMKDERIKKFNKELNKVLDDYCKKFPNCELAHQAWGNALYEVFNIQKYKPNEAFFRWHTERSSMNATTIARHLTWMTYLNDVHDGGGTEWDHQKLKLKAQKGLTVIWPVDWTYTHRGIVSPTETKYIATGWFNYLPLDTVYQTPDSLKDKKGYYFTDNLFVPR
jgi:hypothetical protein